MTWCACRDEKSAKWHPRGAHGAASIFLFGNFNKPYFGVSPIILVSPLGFASLLGDLGFMWFQVPHILPKNGAQTPPQTLIVYRTCDERKGRAHHSAERCQAVSNDIASILSSHFFGEMPVKENVIFVHIDHRQERGRFCVVILTVSEISGMAT